MTKCRCDCGKKTVVRADSLVRRSSQSCGCLRREARADARRSHGESGTHAGGRTVRPTAEYTCWASMIRRCENPNQNAYVGALGITVCKRWRNSFEAFLADMGRKPSPRHSIDRIDKDGNFEPDNCRWVTPSQRNRNRRPYRHTKRRMIVVR